MHFVLQEFRLLALVNGYNATWTGILKKKLRHDSQCNVVIAGNLLESMLAVEVTSHAKTPQASNLA